MSPHHGGRGGRRWEVLLSSSELSEVASEICVVDNSEINEDTSDVVMSFVLCVDSLERYEQWSMHVPSTETAEEDVVDNL